MKILSCWMERGGTGKTTHTREITTTLASLGYKVLIIDIDPQHDTSKLLLDNHITANLP